VALRTSLKKDDETRVNVSLQVASAESYLRYLHPDAQVPKDLLEVSLRESLRDERETFDIAQGELLGLGITRYARIGGSGRQLGGQFKRLCLIFPSGELRTNISNLEIDLSYDRYRTSSMDYNAGRCTSPFLDSEE
jgi:hypothetical protein